MRMLVCTADRPDGWNHSTTNNHNAKTVTLSIFRIVDGQFVYHPASGKQWKYRTLDECDLIHKVTDRIGLRVGSLAYYNPK